MRVLSPLLALSVLFATGCGGGGASSSPADPSTPTPFDGSYTGGFNSGNGTFGTVTLDIVNGRLSGAFAPSGETLQGMISNTGVVDAMLFERGQRFSVTGFLSIDQAGEGTLRLRNRDGSDTPNVTLTLFRTRPRS